MSLALLHAGFSAPGFSPTLDLNFASTLSLTPTSGPTPSFSRASSGTYFGADGLLKYAPFNLVTYSEDFTNAVWTKTRSSISSNVAVAPDGTSTADKLVEAAVSTTHVVSFATTTGGNFSIYAKASERGWIALQQSTSGKYCYFDLTNGIVGSASGATGTITNIGNGWFRCSISVTVASSAWDIFVATGDNGASYTGDGTSGVFIWGAQLESGTALGSYVKTAGAANSAPRFDHTYNGSAWVSKGLLVEEQRTNLCTYSEDFGNAAWTKSGGSVSTNQIAAPDGQTTADKFTENSAGGAHFILGSAGSIANSTIFSVSAFVKKGDRKYIYLTVNDGTSTRLRYTVIFDLDLVQMVNEYSIGSPSNTGYSIADCGNGWFRISAKIQTGSSQTYACETAIGMSDSASPSGRDFTNPTYTGNGSSYFYCWGIQSESGAFPTSYIPTTTASATRSADVCQITGTDFSGFWNATEGSFAVEFDNATPSSGPSWYPMIFAGSDTATNTKRVFFFGEIPTNNFGWLVSDGTTFSKIAPTPYIGNTTLAKAAMCYKLDDLAISLNGSSVLTDLSQPMPTGIDRLQIGHNASANTLCGHISRLRYYPLRLPNATLEDLCNPESQLKLDLQFATNKSLTPVAGPTPSYSRASTGTYFNSSGVLTSAAVNGPRFDHVYNGTSWVSKGLLIEEQRVNSQKWSEDLTNAVFTKSNITVSSSSVLAPNGSSYANQITDNSTNDIHRVYSANTATANQAISFSVFLKQGTARYAVILNSDNNDWRSYCVVDLQTGTITKSGVATAATGASFISATISNCGNGWYRVSVTGTNQTSDQNYYSQIGISNSSTATGLPSYVGAGDYIYAWGLQQEIGASFSSSYISNNGSGTTTRSADVCQITGSDFSGFYNQSEGSFSVEFDSAIPPNSKVGCVFASENSTASNINIPYVLGSNLIFISKYSGANLFNRTIGSITNASAKYTSCYKVNDYASSLNGASILTDVGNLGNDFTKLFIGTDSTGIQIINGHISRLRYYAIRLPNRLLIEKSQ